MADQSEEILIHTYQENSRGVVTGISTDDWTVAEKTRQKPSGSHDGENKEQLPPGAAIRRGLPFAHFIPWPRLRPEIEPCER